MSEVREQVLLALSHAGHPLQPRELFGRIRGMPAAVTRAAVEDLIRLEFVTREFDGDIQLTDAGSRYVERRFERSPFGKYTRYTAVEDGPRLPPQGQELRMIMVRAKKLAALSLAAFIGVPLVIWAVALLGDR